MKRTFLKLIARILLVLFLSLYYISPFFVFTAHAKGQVVIVGEAGKAQVTVNGKSFALKTGLQIKDGVHVIRLKKDVFTSLGINFSEWDMGNTIFVGLKYGGHTVIMEIVHGRRDIPVKIDGDVVKLSPPPYLEDTQMFVPLEPIYQLLGFSIENTPGKIAEEQKPKTQKTPLLEPGIPLETASAPNTKTNLLPAKGSVKKAPQNGIVPILLHMNTGTNIGDTLYITRGGAPIGSVIVIKEGFGWCTAKIVFLENGRGIQPGDLISVNNPQIAETPVTETKTEEKKSEDIITQPPVTTEETQPEINAPVKKKILAVMGFENLSKVIDPTLTTKAVNSVNDAFQSTQQFTLVERDKIGAVLVELHLEKTEFFKPDKAKQVGELLEADLVGVGSIKSVSQSGKTNAMIELSMRIFETETGKVLYSVSAVGKSEGEGNLEYHTGQAMNRAGMFMAQKIPVAVGKITGESAEVSLGVENGLKVNQELPVLRDGKEIGKLVLKALHPKSASGEFVAFAKGTTLREGDQVVNPVKDDTPPKKSKGGMSVTTMLLSVLALGALVGLAGGGGKGGSGDNAGGGGKGGSGDNAGGGGGTTTPNVPPAPPGE